MMAGKIHINSGYGGKLTHSNAAEGEVKMTKQEIVEMIQRAGFEAVERDTVYNRGERIAA